LSKKNATIDSQGPITLSPLNTPVLFLVFNRIDTTKQVFEAIRKAKPPKLYIASDGARKSVNNECDKVKAVRDYIISNIDWECEVKTLFREDNYGCKMAVSDSIDWFFKNEEMGIILEDDCLPSQSFFSFCEELLVKYKDDLRIWNISGDNFQNGCKRGESEYYFSKIPHIWGWASWANRWKHYDVDMKLSGRQSVREVIINIFHDRKVQEYWLRTMEGGYRQKLDTWDYQWAYTCFTNNGLSINPNKNLIKNIGFGVNATHTTSKENRLSNLECYNINTPIILHPTAILPHYLADEHTMKIMINKKNIIKRVTNRILSYF
jgi:hypothetical protein